MKELALMNRYHQTQRCPKPPVEQRVKVMDTLDKKMQTILEREDLSADERLKLYDQCFTRYLNVHDDYRSRPVVSRMSISPPAVIETETKDAIEEEILESVPKTMKTKDELLAQKMKADPNIAWSEKGELKFKGETVRGSNVVDLVNDVLRKRKYFNPQGWETFGEALREATVPQDLIGHEDRWRYVTHTKRTPRSRKRQQSPLLDRTPKNTKKQKERTEVETTKGAVVNMGVDILQPFGSRQLWRI
jgi:hypothetical protein